VQDGKPHSEAPEALRVLEQRDTPCAAASAGLTVSLAIDWTLQALLAVALIAELAVVFFSVLARWLFDSPWLWANELGELALATMAFIGGAYTYRRGDHASIRTLVDLLPVDGQRVCRTLVDFLVLLVAGVAGVSSLWFCAGRWGQVMPVLQIPAGWFVLPLVPCMLVLAVTSLQHLFTQHRPTVLAVGAALGGLGLVLALTQDAWKPWMQGDAAGGVTLAIFFATVGIGLPVGFALLLSAIVYLRAATAMPAIMLAQTMTSGITGFVLLAIPFFVFAGIIMEKGGISLRLIRLVETLVGHFRGGLYQVMVASMYLVSGLSGSEGADVAAVGLVLRDSMRRKGYNMERATAVLAAGAAMGVTVPPSLAMLVLVSATTLSAGALFIAGFIPAAVVAFCLMGMVYVQSRGAQAHRAPQASGREIGAAALGAVLPFLLPAILFGGIFIGLGTPTEVSSFAAVYGIVLAGFIYREFGVRAFLRSLVDSAALTGMILFILAAASSFAWVLTIAKLPQRLVGVLTIGGQQWLFLIASILLILVAGMILEGLAAVIILAPILLPIAEQMGVSQLHYGIVLLMAMNTGAFMPPVGVGFYFSCAVLETTLDRASREMIPYFFVLVLGLVIVALVPWFTLFLPTLLHATGV
jgi:tripartite ATP-independent transporter DctM subunit